MGEKYPYQKQWKEYKGRRRIKFFFWIVYCILLLILYFSDISMIRKGIFALVLIAGFFAIEFYTLNFYCPRCGHKFFKLRKWFRAKDWTRCDECGLKLYEGSKFNATMID